MSEKPADTPPDPSLESDSRFPSGEWTGFFLDPAIPGKHWMDLRLTFKNGQITGDGRDYIGNFVFKGRYETKDGQCWWNKSYVKQHTIFYKGYNEGKGIWGLWSYQEVRRGGFHIWPIAMGDPTQMKLKVEAKAPVDPAPAPEVAAPVEEKELVPAGA